MAHLFSRRWTIALFALFLLLVSSACLTSTAGSPGQSQSSGGDVVFGPGDFLLPDPTTGLADLTSYKAILTLSFVGTRAGAGDQWSQTYVMLTSKDPAARQLTLEKTGDLSDLTPMWLAEADGASYERLGTNACTATVIEQDNTLGDWFEPAGFLTGVHGAEAAGNETVNGIAAEHYTFDEQALGQVDIAVSTGEMWVAPGAGYIVKYVLSTVGNSDYFGDGIEGTLTWDYELTDVNQSIAIQLPADCPAGMVNAPLLPDASNVVNVPGFLSYDTSSGLADAAAFYQAQIPGLGWEALDDSRINENTALLDFSQGDQTLTVIIVTGSGGTKVNIVLGSSQGTVPSSLVDWQVAS